MFFSFAGSDVQGPKSDVERTIRSDFGEVKREESRFLVAVLLGLTRWLGLAGVWRRARLWVLTLRLIPPSD